MPKAKLTDHVEEAVTLLTRTTGGEVTADNPFGEQRESFVDGATYTANVQPLGAGLRDVYGLTATAEALRVQLPAVLIVPLDRLRYRGRIWRAVSAEAWQSYTVVIAEAMP